jgi:hypothetical protein
MELKPKNEISLLGKHYRIEKIQSNLLKLNQDNLKNSSKNGFSNGEIYIKQ